MEPGGGERGGECRCNAVQQIAGVEKGALGCWRRTGVGRVLGIRMDGWMDGWISWMDLTVVARELLDEQRTPFGSIGWGPSKEFLANRRAASLRCVSG